jgi:ribosomal protein L37AE/L43A
VITYGKTTKTACGKRVRTTALVSRDHTNCPDCRRAVAHDRTEAAALRALAEDMLRAHGCPVCGAEFDDIAAWADHNREEHGCVAGAAPRADHET